MGVREDPVEKREQKNKIAKREGGGGGRGEKYRTGRCLKKGFEQIPYLTWEKPPLFFS